MNAVYMKYMSTADPEKQRTPEFETRRVYKLPHSTKTHLYCAGAG